MPGDPQCKITSGSYCLSRSVQYRTATRNSCAKLASISLTFSLTVNPFLLPFSHCFVPLTVRSLLSFPPFYFFKPLLQVATLSEVIDMGSQRVELETDNGTEKLRGLTKHKT